MPMPIRFDVRYGRANPTPGTRHAPRARGTPTGGPNSGYVVETDDNRLATVRVFDDLATLEDANQATHATHATKSSRSRRARINRSLHCLQAESRRYSLVSRPALKAAKK